MDRQWVRWRRRRFRALMASGVSRDGAFRFANSEAKLRQRVSRVIGYDAARAAELECVQRGASVGFVLTGNAASLTPGQVEAIENLSCRSAKEAA